MFTQLGATGQGSCSPLYAVSERGVLGKDRTHFFLNESFVAHNFLSFPVKQLASFSQCSTMSPDNHGTLERECFHFVVPHHLFGSASKGNLGKLYQEERLENFLKGAIGETTASGALSASVA